MAHKDKVFEREKQDYRFRRHSVAVDAPASNEEMANQAVVSFFKTNSEGRDKIQT